MAGTKRALKPLSKLSRIKEPLSVGLFNCSRCGAALYEMPGDVNWCRYFECRNCETVFHFEQPAARPKKKRRTEPCREKERFEFKLVPGRRHRSELDVVSQRSEAGPGRMKR